MRNFLLISCLFFIGCSGRSGWDSRSAWQGYANGVRAGCGTLVYDIDGQEIPEEISEKLYVYAEKVNLCEKLYNRAIEAGKTHQVKR